MMNMKLWLVLLILCGALSNLLAQDAGLAAFAILVDNTGSMRPQFAREIDIAKEVLKQSKSGSSFSLFGFATDPNKEGAKVAAGVECTKDREEVSKQLDGISIVGGQTTLFDAMKAAADRLGSAKPEKCGDFVERILVVISDGEDRISLIKSSDLILGLKQNGTKVFVVGLLDDLYAEGGFLGKSPKDKAKEFLQKLSKDTGGKVVFPKKKQTVTEIVKDLFIVETKPTK